MKCNDFFNFFTLELILTLLISCIFILVTFLFSGFQNIKILINGLTSLNNFTSLLIFLGLFMCSLVLFSFRYFVNLKNKNRIFLTSQLFDYCLNLTRIIGGIFLALIIIHILFKGASTILMKYMVWSILAISQVSIFSCLKQIYLPCFSRPIY